MDSPNEMLSEAFFRIYWISIRGKNKEIKAWETHWSRLVLSPRWVIVQDLVSVLEVM